MYPTAHGMYDSCLLYHKCKSLRMRLQYIVIKLQEERFSNWAGISSSCRNIVGRKETLLMQQVIQNHSFVLGHGWKWDNNRNVTGSFLHRFYEEEDARVCNRVFYLCYLRPGSPGSLHLGLNMERNSIYKLTAPWMKLDSYLPCPCDDFSQEIAMLRRIEALWEKIEHLLNPPMLRRRPTPSQIVTLWRSLGPCLRTHSALQKNPK